MKHKLIVENWRTFLEQTGLSAMDQEKKMDAFAKDLEDESSDTEQANDDEDNMSIKDLMTAPTMGSLYDGSEAPSWMKTGSALRLLTTLEHFGTEEQIYNSIDLLIRETIKLLKMQDTQNTGEIPDGTIKNLQARMKIKADGDVGPTTFGAMAILNSPTYGINKIQESQNLFTSFSRTKTIKEAVESLLTEAKGDIGVLNLDVYINEMASSKSLKKAVEALNVAGQPIRKPPRADESAPARSLDDWREDKEFLSGVESLASEVGLLPEELLALFAIETAGTFSSRIENTYGFTGLIQFQTVEGGRKSKGKNMKATMVQVSKLAGRKSGYISKKELKEMSRAEQLKLVRIYLTELWEVQNLPKDFIAARVYCSILWPAGNRLRADQPVLADDVSKFTGNHPYSNKLRGKAVKAYNVNQGAIKNKIKPGIITIRDFDNKIKQMIKGYKLEGVIPRGAL